MSSRSRQNSNAPTSPYLARTKNLKVEGNNGLLTEYESTFMWRVLEKFENQQLYSPVFTSLATDNKKINWYLVLDRCKGCYDLHIKCINPFALGSEEMKIKSFIVNKNNVECNFRETVVPKGDKSNDISIKNFVSIFDLADEKKGLIDLDFLTIVCKINFGEDKFVEDFNIHNSSMHRRLKEFDDFEEMLECDYFSDVKLIVENQEIWAHKSILSARSRVFFIKFLLRQTNVVYINDTKYNVMKEVLRYIYAGKVDNINNLAKDLLVAAEYYEIDGLKSVCEQVLIKDINIENIDEMLLLVDRHISVDSLKRHALDFLNDNAKDIIDTPKFQNLLQVLTPTMLSEVLQVVLKFKK